MGRHSTKFTGVFYRDSKTNDKSDKTYYIRFKDLNGIDKEIKMGKYSEGIRENYCNQKRNEILTKQRLGEEPPAATRHKKKDKVLLSNLAKEYFKTRKDGNSKKSDELTFQKHLEHFFDDMELATKRDIEKLKKELEKKTNNRGEPLSEKTINNILTILISILNFAEREDLLKNSITKYITKYSIDNSRERFLSRREIAKLLKRLEDEDFQLQLFTKLSLSTGGRLTTIASIKKKDIDFEHNTISLKDYKNNSTYTGFLTDELKNILLEHVKKLKNEDNLFSLKPYTISEKLREIFDELFNKDTNIEDRKNRVVTHTLRHTFASHLAINGTPIYTIQKLMNHKDIKMTLRYAKLAPDSGREFVENLLV
jgi:integrase